jgi:hypothetical protein
MRLIMAVGLVLGGALAQAEEPANLVENPGFEELGPEGFAVGWNGGSFGKPGANVSIDATVAHSGQRSVKVGVSAGSFVTCAAARIDVKPSTKYCLTWWCRTEGFKRSRAYVFFQTNQAQRVFPEADQFGTQDWTEHFAEYTTTAEETWLYPVLTTQDTGGTNCFTWFDDVALYEGAFPAATAAAWRARQRALSGVSETAVVLAKTPDLTLWSDNLEARIYREDGLSDTAKPAKEITVSAARGEEEFVQLALIPAADLKGVTVTPGDLRGPGTIAAANVRWWPVGCANIKVAQDPKTRLGLTPDPLLDPGPVDAPKGQNATFCIGLRVPRDAKAGLYRGQIALSAGGRELAKAPVSLRVRGFALPEDPTFRTLITFSPSSFSPWDKRPVVEIEHDICRVLHDHGIRGHGATVTADARIEDGKVVCDFAPLDSRIAWVMENLHFNAFFLGPMFGGGTSEGWEAHSQWLGLEPLSPEFNRLFPEYMHQVAQHLREKGWLDKAYLYLWDEPEADYFDQVVALQKLALQGDPGFKIWETTSPSYEAFWGVVKAWSVPFGRPYFEEEAVDGRRRAGDEIWVYNIPATLEGPTQIHRLWFWQAARYGAVGAQLWQTTFYHDIDPWQEITPKPYPVGRGKTSLYYYDAGQAILLYPNPQGSAPPLASLRLKLLKKGIDDFEYLTILQHRFEQAARRRGVADPQAEAQKKMREVAAKLVKNINSFTLDSAALERVRSGIADEIEALGEGQGR